MKDFSAWYNGTEHCRLSRRPVLEITMDNINNVSRWQLERFLESRGVDISDEMPIASLRAKILTYFR